MKNIFKYLNLAILFAVLSTAFVACDDNDEDDLGNVGLNIKVFSPTMVVPGQAMTINGSGFGDVVEVEFPGNIKVTDFEIVTNEMIRVAAPKDLSESGPIIVRNSAGKTAESRLSLSVGEPEITNFSAQEGDTIKGNESLTIYGKDLLCIESAEFLDEDSTAIVIKAEDFPRVTATRVVIPVPAKVYDGIFAVKINMGSKVIESPVYKFEPAKESGYWETKKVSIWTNDGSVGVVDWNGIYRFSSADASTGEECYAIPMDQWEIIKTGEFKVVFEGANPQIRVTNGWWDANFGDDIMPGNELLVDNGDGTWTLTISLVGTPVVETIDEKHLLFTGGGFAVKEIYYEESVWIEGEAGHWETKTLWKNDGSIGVVDWNGIYRFSSANASTGEECYAFPMEDWEIIKNGEFKVLFEGASPQIRVTNGWWDANFGDDIMPGNELLVDNGDGTWTLTISLVGTPVVETIDEKHLLFTGGGFTVKEIFVDQWVEGGSAAPKETVIWENDGSIGVVDWNGIYRFSSADASTGEECYAIPMDQWEIIKTGEFKVDFEGASPQIRVTNGWWDANFGDDIMPGNELLVDNGDGTWTLTISLAGTPVVETIDEKHLLFTGGGFAVKKIYYFE